MKHCYLTTISIKKLGITIIWIGLLLWLGSAYQVGAAPPEPGKGPISLPGPTPPPVRDIRAKLQPYQPRGSESLRIDEVGSGKIALSAGLNTKSTELPANPAGTIAAELQQSQADNGKQAQPGTRLAGETKKGIGALALQTFYATADATVLQGHSTMNFGDTTDMWAGFDDNPQVNGMIARSLIQFNISALPPNQTITKATLRVYLVASRDYPNTYRTVTTYRPASTWSESNVTWNNAPGYSTAYGSKSIRNNDFNWHQFDVTNLVKAWYNGTYPNHGIMLRGPEISGVDSSWRGFATREDAPRRPELVIEYSTGLEPPFNLTALALSDMQILLNWQDINPDEQGFKIEQSLTGIGGWQEIATTAATTHAPPGLNCGTTYYYRVRAYRGALFSDYSNIASATTHPCPIEPPTELEVTAVSSTTLSLFWKDNSDNETGFKIERSSNGTNWTQVATVGVNIKSYTDTNLNCGTTYYYRVRAYNGVVNSGYSDPANRATHSCDQEPPPPTNLIAMALLTGVDLSWQDNSDNETSFKIERSLNGINWTEIGTVGANVTSFSDVNVVCDTAYYYRVRAYNAFGASSYSNVAFDITPVCEIHPPTDLRATTVSTNAISLSWKDNTDDEINFRIERSPNKVTWTEVDQVGPNITSYTDTTVECSKSYYYRVWSNNPTGASPYSNVANTATTPCSQIYLPLLKW